MSKKKPSYGWVFSESTTNSSTKPSDALKRQVEEAMKPILEEATSKLEPIREPQKFRQGINFYGKWNRNFYYVYQKLKCPPDDFQEEYDYGVARFKYVGNNQFDMAYFRHTGKWEDLFTHCNMTLQECIESLKSDHFFLPSYM